MAKVYCKCKYISVYKLTWTETQFQPSQPHLLYSGCLYHLLPKPNIKGT